MPRKKKENATYISANLPNSVIRMAELIGDNRTDGIERLFAKLPALHRVVVLLEALSNDPETPSRWKDSIEATLDDLNELEIDRVYKEAVAAGVITVKNAEGESTAWIV